MYLPISKESEAAIEKGWNVVAEVMKAPKLRIDNVITHLNHSLNVLLIHAKVAEDVRQKYLILLWSNRIKKLDALTTGIGMTALGTYSQLPLEISRVIVALRALLEWVVSIGLTG